MAGFKHLPKHKLDSEKLESFLDEARTSTQESVLPQESQEEEEEARIEAADDTRLRAAVNFRMTEKELYQLRYIAKHMGISINSFIRMAVQAHLPKGVELARKRKKEKLF